MIETFVEAVPLENIFMLHPYVFPPSRRSPLHDAIEEYVAIRRRKRVTEKKVTEIADELSERQDVQRVRESNPCTSLERAVS